VETVAADTERDYFMSATEAAEYGLVDQVLRRGDERAAATAGENGK